MSRLSQSGICESSIASAISPADIARRYLKAAYSGLRSCEAQPAARKTAGQAAKTVLEAW